MVKVTGKIMEERIKHGWTLNQISQSYGVSEEEFLEALKKTFSSKAYKGMLARLRKNEKIAHKAQKEEIIAEEVVSYDESNQPETSTAIEEQTVDSENSSEDSIESLQLQKEELQNVLNRLELEHKALASQRVQIRNRISDYKAVLLDMQSKIRQYQTELEALVSELDEKFASMQTVNSSICEAKTALAEIDSKIEAKQKTFILVYEKGNLEIESSFEFEIEQDDWSTLFNKLIKDELVDSLTVKQIRGLSKCIALVKYLNSQGFKYEIAFENSIVEALFTKIFNEE